MLPSTGPKFARSSTYQVTSQFLMTALRQLLSMHHFTMAASACSASRYIDIAHSSLHTRLNDWYLVKAGTRCGDIWTYICCCLCALCQETRTLMQNNVVAETWHGTALAMMKNSQRYYACHHHISCIWPQGLSLCTVSLLRPVWLIY